MIQTIAFNLALPWAAEWNPFGRPDHKRRRQIVDRAVQSFNIKTSGAEAPMDSLSGGNQQKVLVSRWMEHKPKILILDEPTRGVDVGAREEMFQIVAKLVEEGLAVLLISSDLVEVLNMSHRVAVYRNGRILETVPAEAATMETVMHQLTGARTTNAAKRMIPLFIAWVLLLIIFRWKVDTFLAYDNMIDLMQQISVNAIIACGMTYCILIGGIDLSVGAVLALVGTVTVWTLAYGEPAEQSITRLILAIAAGLGVAGAVGLFNGFCAAKTKMPPFIITLGTMLVARGLALRINEVPIRVPSQDTLFLALGNARIGGWVPVPVIVMLILLALGTILLHRTKFGQHLYAIGGNREAARFTGIPVSRRELAVYVICALLTGVEGDHASQCTLPNPIPVWDSNSMPSPRRWWAAPVSPAVWAPSPACCLAPSSSAPSTKASTRPASTSPCSTSSRGLSSLRRCILMCDAENPAEMKQEDSENIGSETPTAPQKEAASCYCNYLSAEFRSEHGIPEGYCGICQN